MLLTILVAIGIAALLLYVVNRYANFDSGLKQFCNIAIVVVLLLVVARDLGVLHI